MLYVLSLRFWGVKLQNIPYLQLNLFLCILFESTCQNMSPACVFVRCRVQSLQGLHSCRGLSLSPLPLSLPLSLPPSYSTCLYVQGKRIVGPDGVESINDMFHENSLLQEENDKLRHRVKALQETIDSLTSRNASLENDRAAVILGGLTGMTARRLRSVTLQYVILRYVTLQYVTLRYVTLQDAGLRGIIIVTGSSVSRREHE